MAYCNWIKTFLAAGARLLPLELQKAGGHQIWPPSVEYMLSVGLWLGLFFFSSLIVLFFHLLLRLYIIHSFFVIITVKLSRFSSQLWFDFVFGTFSLLLHKVLENFTCKSRYQWIATDVYFVLISPQQTIWKFSTTKASARGDWTVSKLNCIAKNITFTEELWYGIAITVGVLPLSKLI